MNAPRVPPRAGSTGSQAQDNGNPGAPCGGAGCLGSRQVGWIGLGGWFGCVRRRVGRYLTHLRESHAAWRRLGRICRGVEGLGAPYICATPQKCRARSCSCRRASCPVLPQYLSGALGDLSRGSGQFVPNTHSAIEHLTRSRRNCRTPGSFSCRFLSWPVREGPTESLYAISDRPVPVHARRVFPAAYAVPRVPVRRAWVKCRRGDRVSASQRPPLWLLPMRPIDHLPGKSGYPAPKGVQSPLWSSRTQDFEFTTARRIPSWEWP